MPARHDDGPDGRALLPAPLVGSPLPTGVVDAAGRWVEHNAALERLLGAGNPDLVALVADPESDVRAALAGGDHALVLRLRIPGGTAADAVAVRWPGEDGRRLVQVVDRGETDRLAERLGRTTDALARFASRVSHDLKNPMGTAMGFAELIEMGGATDDELAEYTRRLRSSVGRAIELLDELVAEARSVDGVGSRRHGDPGL